MDATWTQAYAAMAQVFVSLLQCGLIGWGLWQMQRASYSRDRQLDRQDKIMEQQGKALENIGLGIQELLKRSA